MRLFFLFCFLLFSSNVICQGSKMATITFNTSKVKLGKGIYIEILKFQRDSGNYILLKKINVIKPVFSITLEASDPIECKLYLKKNDSTYYDSPMFYVSDEPISVLFDKPLVILRSRQNDFYQKNMLVYLAMPATIRNEYGFSYSLLKQSYEMALLPRYLLLELKIKEYENNIIELVKTNRTYYRTLNVLYNIRDGLSPKTLETCFKILRPFWQRTTMIKQLEEYIVQEKKIFIGKLVPNLNLLNLDLVLCQSKDFYSLYDFTFLDFWASWCGPCRAQTKVIQAMYPGIDTGRMHIASVSIDEDQKKWMQAVRQDSIVWNNYIDRKGGWDGNVAKNFNLTYIPANVIVDKTGKIVAVNVTTEGLKDFMIDQGVMKIRDK